MDDTAIAVVVNPRAGRGRALHLLPRIAVALRLLRAPQRIHVTTEPDEATDVARRLALAGVRVVVAVGGDGTINEVAGGLIASGRPTALGVIPAGRANDFARSLGAPRDPEAALARCLRDPAAPVDVGRATLADGASRVFVNAAGVGFDAAVSERSVRSRLPGSTLPYLSAIGRSLLVYRNLEVSIEADGRPFSGRVCSVIAANGRYLGGGMKYAPDADVRDGWLDLAIVGDIGKADLLRQVPRLYRGTHVTHPKFSLVKVRAVRIETATPARVQLESELFGATPVTFTVEPGGLLVAGCGV